MLISERNKNYYIKQWIIVFFVCFLPFNSQSQITIRVNDTTLQKGSISEIPLYGRFTQTGVTELQLEIEYNALNFNILGVEGDENFIMRCPNTLDSLDYSDITRSKILIKCDDIQNMEAGIFCNLIVETLTAPDSVSDIKPISIIVDGKIPDSVSMIPGRILVPGTIVIQTFPEGIESNFPNPFYEYTNFPISIHEPTKLRFRIYSGDGKYVISNDELKDFIELTFYKNNTELPVPNIEQKMDKGKYYLKLIPDNMQFASGTYFLIMFTDNSVYSRKFIYIK